MQFLVKSCNVKSQWMIVMEKFLLLRDYTLDLIDCFNLEDYILVFAIS